MAKRPPSDAATRYVRIMESLFSNHGADRVDSFEWDRSEISSIAEPAKGSRRCTLEDDAGRRQGYKGRFRGFP